MSFISRLSALERKLAGSGDACVYCDDRPHRVVCVDTYAASQNARGERAARRLTERLAELPTFCPSCGSRLNVVVLDLPANGNELCAAGAEPPTRDELSRLIDLRSA